MSAGLRQRFTYANVVATIAVFIALGGSAYAAVALPANSVGTKQIKNNAVTSEKISPSAQRALRGRDGTNGRDGYNGRDGASGANGTQGVRGSDGRNGATSVTTRSSVAAEIPAGHPEPGGDEASCQPGEHATGGGARSVNYGTTTTAAAPIVGSYPVPSTYLPGAEAWHADVLNNTGTSIQFYVYVICASP